MLKNYLLLFSKKSNTLLFILFTTLIPLAAQEIGTFFTNSSIDFESITWSPNGSIYTVDFYAGKVYKIHNNELKLLGSGYGNVAGGGLDAEGNFYFSAFQQGRIYKVNRDDSVEEFASGLSQPVGLQLSTDENFFYVVEYTASRVRKISLADGSISNFVAGNGISGPDGMALMPNGDVLVANFNNNKVHRLTPEGQISLFATHPQSGNMGYIAKAGDYYYVPSVNGHTVARIDAEGHILPLAGMPNSAGAMDGNINEATFNGPNGICANPAGDTLLVTDRQGRIRYITQLDEFMVSSLNETVVELAKVYPSPFLDKVTVEYNCTASCDVQVQLVDVQGKVHVEQSFQSAQFQQAFSLAASQVARGIYFLQIFEDGILKSRQKVVKK